MEQERPVPLQQQQPGGADLVGRGEEKGDAAQIAAAASRYSDGLAPSPGRKLGAALAQWPCAFSAAAPPTPPPPSLGPARSWRRRCCRTQQGHFLRATRSHLGVVPVLVLLGCGESGRGDCCCCSGGCEQGPLLALVGLPTPCTITGSCSGTGPLAAWDAAPPDAVTAPAPPPPPPYPAPDSPALEVQQPKAASRKQNEPIVVRAALTPAEA